MTREPAPDRSRRRLSYAHVAAGLALFLSLSSGALAARHYLIRSTHQIAPRVIAVLRAHAGVSGAPGAAGPQGASGARGPAGDPGVPGPPAAVPATLAPGATETGVWGGSWEGVESRLRYRATASFPIALAAPLTSGSVAYIPAGAAASSACPGVGRAAPGKLCLYEAAHVNLLPPSAADVFDPEADGSPFDVTGRHGFAIELRAVAEDATSVQGSFALTAPSGGGVEAARARARGPAQ